jgi:hypothetical protein
MNVNSPLGQYSQIVAAIVAVGVIGIYAAGTLLSVNVEAIKEFALIALGAVFGSAATVNGVKRDVQAIQTRLDKASIPAAKNPI